MSTLLRRIGLQVFACASVFALVACAGHDGASDAPAAPGDEQDITAASSLVGKWQIDSKTDTDSVATWWEALDLNKDGTFTGSEGGNVCDDDGNCEAGTTGDLKGTYTLGKSGDKQTILFHFTDKKLATDRFTFSISSGELKMQLAADKQKGGDFQMKRAK